jgi:hypothetical protein
MPGMKVRLVKLTAEEVAFHRVGRITIANDTKSGRAVSRLTIFKYLSRG